MKIQTIPSSTTSKEETNFLDQALLKYNAQAKSVAEEPITFSPIHDPSSKGLTKYSDAWTAKEARHLISRATYGVTRALLTSSLEMGLEATVEQLLADMPMPSPPLNYENEDDEDVAIGETWVDAQYVQTLNGYRANSLRAWMIQLMIEEGFSVREKMVMFWHNHYVTSGINDARFNYDYINTIRDNALGNFRELTKKITVNPSMLIFLNGFENQKEAPNENYARELLELFTIGKGELAGPGDYSTFTEQDVLEIAKALTGWSLTGFRERDSEPISSLFFNQLHDTTTKQLSHRFNNTQIQNNGEEEYKDVVDTIFEQDEVSRFICRKLYRYFVYYTINDQVEQNVIEPMARIMRDNDYEIMPALKALFQSEHFYDELNQGVMIKNPMEHQVSVLRNFEVEQPTDLAPLYIHMRDLYRIGVVLQMALFDAPSVAGWKAWYQEPAYNQLWINSNTLPFRVLITDVFATVGNRRRGFLMQINVLKFIESIPNAADPNTLIEEIAQLIFTKDILPAQVDFLKEILIPGLPDFEWTLEYENHLSNPDDEAIKEVVDFRLRVLIKAMMNMPEFMLT